MRLVLDRRKAKSKGKGTGKYKFEGEGKGKGSARNRYKVASNLGGVFLIVPSAGYGQCAVLGTPMYTGATFQIVGKLLSGFTATVVCTVGMSMNVTVCKFDGSAMPGDLGCPGTPNTMPCALPYAMHMFTGSPTARSCTFMCGDCDPASGNQTVAIVVNNADGLPVELMDFSLEEDHEEATEEEDGGDRQ